MPVVYFFSLQVDPAHRQALLDALLEHGRDCTAREPGTLRFDVLEDDADAARLYLYEAYADQAAFQAHAAGALHQQAVALLRQLREAGTVTSDVVVRAHSLFTGPAATAG
jgi:autoinducer 2-degrading protein